MYDFGVFRGLSSSYPKAGIGRFSLFVEDIDHKGRYQSWRFDPLRISLDCQERPGRTPRLVLRSGGQTIEIAHDLGEEEKIDFAAALLSALSRWKKHVF